MNAVDSEFRKNLSDEGRRIFQLEKSIIAKKGSVLNRFSTGNLQTLNLPGIRDHLIKFHTQYYSSNIMTLCLVGNYQLDELQEFALTNFGSVHNKNVQGQDFSNEVTFSSENGLGHIYFVVPEKDNKLLKITWPEMPSASAKWRSKPLNYISHVVGHEGPNSLLSELIKQGLATSLSASEK
jgi:insulysin